MSSFRRGPDRTNSIAAYYSIEQGQLRLILSRLTVAASLLYVCRALFRRKFGDHQRPCVSGRLVVEISYSLKLHLEAAFKNLPPIESVGRVRDTFSSKSVLFISVSTIAQGGISFHDANALTTH